MHLSRGHASSNIISDLPFAGSTDLKCYTAFLLHSALISNFQGEIDYERQNIIQTCMVGHEVSHILCRCGFQRCATENDDKTLSHVVTYC